jgi:hypothetical protein
MEGVLDTNYELRKPPSYKAIEVDVESIRGKVPLSASRETKLAQLKNVKRLQEVSTKN